MSIHANGVKCDSCDHSAAVHVCWKVDAGPQQANLCASHAQYVQDRVLAKEHSTPGYSSGLTFSEPKPTGLYMFKALEELANAADESLSCEHKELCPFSQRLRDAVIKARAELVAAVQP